MVGTDWDVTELVQANETSRQALEIAKESNRTKSDFLANMSHEIRTPMNAILGMTYLARRADPSPKQLDYLNQDRSMPRDSLLSIMNDILDFSKIEAGKLELEVISFSLEDVLRSLLDVVGQKAQDKGVALVSSVSPTNAPAYLVGDPLRLGQILINLVNNAIKFTDLGEITIRVDSGRNHRHRSAPEHIGVRYRNRYGPGAGRQPLPILPPGRYFRLRANTAAPGWGWPSASNSAS